MFREHDGVVIDELGIVLATIDGHVCGGPDDGPGKIRCVKSGTESDGRDVVSVGDILQGGAVAEAEPELTSLPRAEHVGRGETDIVLPIVIRAEIVAGNDAAGLPDLPAVLIAESDGRILWRHP